MGFFSKWKQNKQKQQEQKNNDEVMDDIIAWGINNAQDEASRRYYEAQADKQYQADLAAFCALSNEIKETYTVINNVSSFTGADGDSLIERCFDAIDLDNSIREKRDYYDTAKYEYCEPYKILAMIHEKRGDYQRAAITCLLSLQNGYTRDGTNGGMRGRLARMIKKGNLPLTDEMKEKLNILGEQL